MKHHIYAFPDPEMADKAARALRHSFALTSDQLSVETGRDGTGRPLSSVFALTTKHYANLFAGFCAGFAYARGSAKQTIEIAESFGWKQLGDDGEVGMGHERWPEDTLIVSRSGAWRQIEPTSYAEHVRADGADGTDLEAWLLRLRDETDEAEKEAARCT